MRAAIAAPPPLAALCQNAHPHVTLSHAPSVGAVYSNGLLARAAAEGGGDEGGAGGVPAVVGTVLRGTVGFVVQPPELGLSALAPR